MILIHVIIVRSGFPAEILVAVIFVVYSCFDKGCPAKVKKRTRQCRLALWVVRVWFCLIEVQGDSATKNEKNKYVFCFFPPTRLNTLMFIQATVKTAITQNNFRHSRVSFYICAGQPLSKQLYRNE